ncbi:hypothetical protein HK414_09875 [Ramlibacter terrae]|uniref:Uncharacterized protein n=1 Tax=Ramlibacter terrae TaxID=2732511 RepID=A0ABX6P522_9BURK|nr:hypothetical protein HK414_09875 [Ramlibacter terrae]
MGGFKQRPNGWFADCCLGQPDTPLTHTIGYAVRGLFEGWRYSGDQQLLDACVLTSEALLPRISPEGYLPGRFDRDWKPAAPRACMTGSSQIAHNFLLLYAHSRDPRYLEAARALNRFVRRSIEVEGNPDTVGGVRGSFPINGSYGGYRYLNWAAKFTIDAQQMEQAVLGS